MKYDKFLATKRQLGGEYGFTTDSLPDFLFPFQRSIVDWELRRGKGAAFVDTGLGKTPMQLVWSQKIIERINKPVLLLTPLAVGSQTLREAHKFGIDAERPKDGRFTGKRVVIANYERLHYFSPDDFGGVVCDESSAIKSFDGKHRADVTEFMRTVPYRSLWTATAAPNDYIELGTSSEALGELGQIDMLNRFFRNDQNTSDMNTKWRGKGRESHKGWRFKGHAEEAFWRWVSSWARACRMPSDLGFADGDFILPELIEREHIVETRTPAPDMLFAVPATNFREERAERRRTIEDRCRMAADLVNDGEQAVIWCHLNDEGDLLEMMIKDSVQVSGSDSEEEKESSYIGFADGTIRVLIIKPKIGAWGMNWQHCNHVVTFASHSYEQYYQAVRRCWRFGQRRPVTVDLIASEGEIGVKENMRRKSVAADRMFSQLVTHMNDATKIKTGQTFDVEEKIPSWL